MGLFFRVAVALAALFMPALANAAWHEAKSRHFIIYADLKPDEIREYADRLERFDQAVRKVRGVDDPKLTDSQRLTVYALRSEGAVARLAGSRSVSGFYRTSASGAAAFVPRRSGSKNIDWDLDTEEIFFHEYAHHLQLESSSYAIPPWVIEGFAEFFATAKVQQDGSVLIGSPPQYRAYGLFSDRGLRLEQVLGVTYKNLDPNDHESIYGLGWLLTHYLTFEPSRKGQLAQYLDAIQRGTSAVEAAKAAFGDLKQLDRQLDKYMRGKFRGVRVPGADLSIGSIAVRPLDTGETAMMDVHIRSRRGVDKKTAADVVKDARKAAAPFPNDPFVQAALAEAEFDADNYAAAEAAADRALAANPNHVRAMIYKGRARMEAAAGKPDADWKAIRGWFAKANRADTENAEPMMLYFRTYRASGVAPTKNAIDGLLYAVALVPQDNELRVNAVRQMLADNRLDIARSLFAPLAFRPHAPEKYRESNAQIMGAIDAGDGKRALAVLEAVLASDEKAADRP